MYSAPSARAAIPELPSSCRTPTPRRSAAPSRHRRMRCSSSTRSGGTTRASSTHPANLTLVPLPPACPELNAAENVWQYLRETYLAKPCVRRLHRHSPAASRQLHNAIGSLSVNLFEGRYKRAPRGTAASFLSIQSLFVGWKTSVNRTTPKPDHEITPRATEPDACIWLACNGHRSRGCEL
jgi:hypothetical protein